MNAESNTQMMTGRINEKGFLKSLKSMGFNTNRSIGELLGNSKDAKAEKIQIIINGDMGLLVDNGRGMTKDKLDDMFEMFKENKEPDRIGNYGFGAKAALCNLSKQKKTYVITKSVDGPFLTATGDWNKMFNEGKYTGNITIKDSDYLEKEIFNKHLPDAPSGTIIMFPVDVDTIEAIQVQFRTLSPKSEKLKACNTWSVIFGKFDDLEISYISNDGEEKNLEMYNPMKSDQIDGQVSHHSIRYYKHLVNGHKRFIVRKLDTDNQVKDFEVVSSDASNYCEKKISKVRKSLDDYEFINEIELDLYKLKVNGQISGANIMSEYDKQILGDICEPDDIMFDFVPNAKLIRNGNFIGSVSLSKKAARGGGDTRFQMLIHSEISTRPISNQEDPLDELFGIQINKNQLNSGPPKQFTRLVDILKDEFCEELKRQTPDAIKPKVKKAKKENKDETIQTEGNDDDNSSASITSSGSSDTNGDQNVVGELLCGELNNQVLGRSVLPLQKLPRELIDANVRFGGFGNNNVTIINELVDDNEELSGGGKPSKPIDVPSHRKGLVMGSELIDRLGLLVSRLNPEQGYDDSDYITLFNILKKIENKE